MILLDCMEFCVYCSVLRYWKFSVNVSIGWYTVGDVVLNRVLLVC